MRLGITEFVDCAHYLPGHPQCGRMHGHTYKVELVVEGPNEGGMVVDFGELREQARGVLSEYDHTCWNDVLEFPSVENIAELLSRRLQERIRFPFVLRVFEGNGKWVEVERGS